MRGRGEEKFTLLGREPSLNWYTRRSRCQALNWEVTSAGWWAEKTHPTSTVAESSWGHGQGSVWVIRSHSASSQVSVGSQTTGIPGQLLDLRVVPTCEVCRATAPPTGLSAIKLRSHPTKLAGLKAPGNLELAAWAPEADWCWGHTVTHSYARRHKWSLVHSPYRKIPWLLNVVLF